MILRNFVKNGYIRKSFCSVLKFCGNNFSYNNSFLDDKTPIIEEITNETIFGDEERIKRQHDLGKHTARERIEILLDEDSFCEVDTFAQHRCSNFGMDEHPKVFGDGVVCGHGTIEDRLVYIFAQDFTVYGGTISETNSKKICKVIDQAIESGAPIIGIYDSGGARIQEGVDALDAVGELFNKNISASGKVPQISLICGPCAGGSVFSPALTDFTIMNKQNSYMFVTGPNVVKTMTQEIVSFEELGGSGVHSKVSGTCTLEAEDELEMFDLTKELLSYLPQSSSVRPESTICDSSQVYFWPQQLLLDFVPDGESHECYDMRSILNIIVDEDGIFELWPDYGSSLITAFARIGDIPVTILANQPNVVFGSLDCDSLQKAEKIVSFSGKFGLPIISFVDVPGFQAGSEQEGEGIISLGAGLLKSYSEVESPKISVIVKKAFGGAFLMMGCKEADICYAWPDSEIGVMETPQALEVLGNKIPGSTREEKEEYYNLHVSTPFVAASRGFVDDVIAPESTRERIINDLEILLSKQ